MTDFQNKNLVKPFLEKKSQGRKYEGKFRFRQKMQQHRNRYQNLILVSVADTKTRSRSYTTHKPRTGCIQEYNSTVFHSSLDKKPQKHN